MTKSHNHVIVANFVCCDVSDRYIVTLMPTILGGFVESIYIIIFGVVSFVFDSVFENEFELYKIAPPLT